MTLSATYGSNAVAADIGFPVVDVNRYGYKPSAIFLDIPLLSTSHENYGFYGVLYGPYGKFRGGILKMSTDGGGSFREMAYFKAVPALVGICTSTPGAGGGLNMLDYAVSLTVDFSPSAIAPASATDAQLWVGTNLAALGNATLGWELIQFKTATQISGYGYTLTGLLRGLYGTDWRSGSHIANEYLVLLDDLTRIQRISLSDSQVGTTLLYRATPMDVDTAIVSENFACNAVGKKPYAPTQIGGYRDASRNLTIFWKRNDRLAFNIPDLGGAQQIPMSESSESYEVDVRNAIDTATLRTITASSATVSYTAAQQTTDFGSAQNSVKIRVYQMGSLGRGYAGAATV